MNKLFNSPIGIHCKQRHGCHCTEYITEEFYVDGVEFWNTYNCPQNLLAYFKKQS